MLTNLFVFILFFNSLCGPFFFSVLNFMIFIYFVLQSYDATTHFESTVADVVAMYSKITGKVKFNF